MYEPIRHKSVHSPRPVVHNSTERSEHSDVLTEPRPDSLGRQLAGHLAALLSATRRLSELTGDPELEPAIAQLEARVAELAPGGAPPRSAVCTRPADSSAQALHTHAHDLAARVLVVAAARQDTVTAMLACARMDAHAAASRTLSETAEAARAASV